LEEEAKLQQPMNRDSGKEFSQEFFEEESVCSIIPLCPRSRIKAMMGKKKTKHLQKNMLRNILRRLQRLRQRRPINVVVDEDGFK
jgi:hypothetical protein